MKELKLGPTNCCGELWSERFSGRTYSDDQGRYVLSYSGTDVAVEVNGEWQLADDETAERVRRLAREDAELASNRRTIARALSEGNEALEFVIRASMSFNDGEPSLRTFDDYPGIKFAQVGRNASHSFYAGASEDGRRFYLSLDDYDYYYAEADGEEDWAERKANAVYFRELKEWSDVTYWGHG